MPVRIAFLLPNFTHVPIGGFKIIYQYANRLQERGHQVSVVQAPLVRRDRGAKNQLRAWTTYLKRGIGGPASFRPDRWMHVHPAVQMIWRPSFASYWIPEGDAVVATAWRTAEWVRHYPASKGKKFYFIQHLETWNRAQSDRVIQTWKLPLTKIVIARWLKDYAATLGEQAIYVPNAVDESEFGVDDAIQLRNPCHVGMLFHRTPWKGSKDGLNALMSVKKSVPELQVTLFGTESRPTEVPSWVHYIENPSRPDLRRLYNQIAIFVGPSWTEGWGLPPMEAALSGAALCLTDIGGHREFAQHEDTALLSPAQDADALAHNVLRLIQDSALRWRLAHRALMNCQRFTWENSTTRLEAALMEHEQAPGCKNP